MKEQDFLIEKRKVWAKWERHFGMLFNEEFRKTIERNVGAFVDYNVFLGDLGTAIPEFVEPALVLLNNKNSIIVTGKVKPEKRRRKHFERRFYLVRFVTDCWEKDGRSYIRWEYVTTKWNESHASDQISKAVLKAEYYRALKERDIIIQLLLTKVWRNLDTFKLFLLRLQKNYKVNPVTLAKFYRAWLHLVLKEDAELMDEWIAELKIE